MSDNSNIEWTDATWNPVTGCTKVSAGCLNCYAEGVTKRFQWDGPFAPWTVSAQRRSSEPSVYLHADRLNAPLLWRRPRKVFVNSMSDLFHEDVPDGFIYDVFLTMATADRHTFQVLTKRPDRAVKLLPRLKEAIQQDAEGPGWPLPNVWMGVSVENQKNAWRFDSLAQIPAAIRFASCEPLLGPLDLQTWLKYNFYYTHEGTSPPDMAYDPPVLDWVIAGGESGHSARPMHPEWLGSIRDQCFEAKVPFFFKQWGEFRPAEGVWPGDGIAWPIQRVGRKAAGALLGGHEYKEFPS